jgi:dienelactone hydrolase
MKGKKFQPDVSPDAPWKQRYRAPRLMGPRAAFHAPDRGMFISTQTGVLQTYAWDLSTNTTRQVSNRKEGLFNAVLDPFANYFYFLNDTQGNEIGHLARFPFASTLEEGPVEDLTPDLPPFSPGGYSFSLSGRWAGFTASYPDGFHIYLIELAPDGGFSTPRKLCHFDALSFGPALSYHGEVAVMMTTEKSGKPEFNLVAFDAGTGERISELWDGENTSIEMLGFFPLEGDLRFLATSNRSGQNQLLVWNIRTSERTDLVLPGVEGSVSATAWSQDGRWLVIQALHKAQQSLYLYNLETAELRHLAAPTGMYSAPIFRPNGELYISMEDPAHPARVVALDLATGQQKRTVIEASAVPPGHAWRSVTFPSTNGAQIQGWLSTPPGEGPFPAIVEMIGGPGGVKTASFSPNSQAWVDHGCAFLTINYRGCSTFGREHESVIFGNPGYWETDDIAAAQRFLVEQGIADPERLLVTGWSYGGYLTLMSLSKYPELWAGGMAGIAIADWSIQWEDTADTLRGFQEAILGGTPHSNPEQYAKSSPITYAQAVRAPVLIIQGRNDTRTPARPIEVYEQKMKALGKDIEVVWFETGHAGSFADIELGISHMEKMLRFAQRVLERKS